MRITGIRKIGEGCLILGFCCHWCYCGAFCLQLWSKAGPHSLLGSEAPKGNSSVINEGIRVSSRKQRNWVPCLGLLSLEECGLLVVEKRNKGPRAWPVLLMPWEEIGICHRALVKIPGFGLLPHRGYSRSNDRAEQTALGRTGFPANPFYFWTKSWWSQIARIQIVDRNNIGFL